MLESARTLNFQQKATQRGSYSVTL